MLKVKQKTWGGKIVTESVADAVRRNLCQVGGHGYGQVEQIQADIEATQEMLLRLIEVLGPALDKDEIYQLLGKTEENAYYTRLEVVGDEDDE